MKKLTRRIKTILLFTTALFFIYYTSTIINPDLKGAVEAATTARVVQNVTDEDELIVAGNLSNVDIILNNDIVLTKKVEFRGTNIAVLGNSHTISVTPINDTENMLVIRNSDISLKDLTVSGYATNGITVYRTSGIRLENVKLVGGLVGDTKSSNVGIDLDRSEVVLKNIESSNHKYGGIRLRNTSNINVEGAMLHNNDHRDLQVVNNDGEQESQIVDAQNLYVRVGEASGSGKTNLYYQAKKVTEITSFDEMERAITIPNHKIVLMQDINFTKSLEVNQSNISVEGNNHVIDLGGQFEFIVKANQVILSDLTFKNYVGSALKLYRVRDNKIQGVTFEGNDISLDNDSRSKVGVDIYDSTVKLQNITSKNHMYKGIQVRDGSSVDIDANMTHIDDNIHMQTIKTNNDTEIIVKDPGGVYVHGSLYQKENLETVDYFVANTKMVKTIREFMDAAIIPGTTVTLENDLTLQDSDFPSTNTEKKVQIANNIVVDGRDYTVDLNSVGSILLRGNDINVKNLTIKKSNEHGVNIYNARNVVLENTTIQNSKRWGLFVNGSTVNLKKFQTIENDEGGIRITRSRTLRLDGHQDSVVEADADIYQRESNINVGVLNLEMLNSTISDNKFIVPADKYNEYVNDTRHEVLSDYYLDFFGITGEDRNRKYASTEIDYMVVQKTMDVTNHKELADNGGGYVHLKGDGTTDNTENLEKLIEYAALNGRVLYFPEGTYVIKQEIDLSKINLPALSNFTLKGDPNGLSVIDGTSMQGKMLLLSSAEYHSILNYVSIEGLVFNNIGFEVNGPHKKGISFTNNGFINGKYRAHLSGGKKLDRVTLEPYILVKNSKYVVENNVFLRGDKYIGRGVATYRTKNASIKNNHFGMVEDLADARRMLPKEVIDKTNLIKNSGLVESTSQGNFMTAINNERYDENVLIQNNYFNIDKTRNIIADFDEDVLVSGLNVSVEGQRRDHIIYSKSYNNLKIVGNYFKGMENSAAGGVKIRNGENAYVGSNYFNDVPILTYIYGDLTKDETVLHDTVIYNNIFQVTTNFGKQGTGILYYQSFRDGDDLTYKQTGEVWSDAYGDVKNFAVYNNQFFSDKRDRITISSRAQKALKDIQFVSSGNVYGELGGRVNYHSGNANLPETSAEDMIPRIGLESGYHTYKDTPIPLTPVSVDAQYLNKLTSQTITYIQSLYDTNLIGAANGQYAPNKIKEIQDLLEQIKNYVSASQTRQADINRFYTELETIIKDLAKNDGSSDTDDKKPDTGDKKPDTDDEKLDTGEGNNNAVNNQDRPTSNAPKNRTKTGITNGQRNRRPNITNENPNNKIEGQRDKEIASRERTNDKDNKVQSKETENTAIASKSKKKDITIWLWVLFLIILIGGYKYYLKKKNQS